MTCYSNLWFGGVVLVLFINAVGCVSVGTHKNVLANIALTRTNLKSAQDKYIQCAKEKQELEKELLAVNTRIYALESSFEATRAHTKNNYSVAYPKKVVENLAPILSDERLEVKVRHGLILLHIPAEVIFVPGTVQITHKGRSIIFKVAQILSTFDNQRFQVMGHSDSSRVYGSRFSSNWELSVQRAIEVVKLLVHAGVSPELVSAAGYAEFDPLVNNNTHENRAINRRIEIFILDK